MLRRRNGMPRTLWNRDIGPTVFEQNSYGSHPFVLALEPGEGGRAWSAGQADGVSCSDRLCDALCCCRSCADGSAWGMVLLNSNAMDIVPSHDQLRWEQRLAPQFLSRHARPTMLPCAIMQLAGDWRHPGPVSAPRAQPAGR